MARRHPNQILSELAALADDVIAQAAYAGEVLVNERRTQLIGPLLAVFEAYLPATVRPTLRTLYAELDRDGVQRDAGGDFRAAILRLLRPWLTFDDQALLERAVTTYEYLPPGRHEAAAAIRAGGLLGLVDLTPDAARYHAARLLVDDETSRFSGEPARTAAAVLAAQGELTVLYLYTLQERTQEEVLVECLRGLARAPEQVIAELMTRCGAQAGEAAQIGVIELLLAVAGRPFALDELRLRLRTTQTASVYRYLVTAMAASRQRTLWQLLIDAAAAEPLDGRREALREALALVAYDASVAAALDGLRAD